MSQFEKVLYAPCLSGFIFIFRNFFYDISPITFVSGVSLSNILATLINAETLIAEMRIWYNMINVVNYI